MKDRTHLLAQPLTVNMAQDFIIKQLIEYCKFQKRDPAYITELEKSNGFCSGLTQLVLYGLWLETQPKRYIEGKPVTRDDWTWIKSTLEAISEARTEADFLKIANNVERLLTLINQHQIPRTIIPGVQQYEFERYFADTANRTVQREPALLGFFTVEDLCKDMKLSAHDEKEATQSSTTMLDMLAKVNIPLYIGGRAHAIGLFKYKDIYYLYDSNDWQGIRCFTSSQKNELAKAIMNANLISLPDAIYMEAGFTPISYDQKLILPKIPRDRILEQTQAMQRISSPGFRPDHYTLHAAIEQGSLPSLKFYLEHIGKDKLNQKNPNGKTALDLAIGFQNKEAIQLLLEQENIQISENTLINMVKYGNIDGLKMLMQSGKLTDAMKINALHYAAAHNYEMIAPLLAAYPKMRPINADAPLRGITPFQTAMDAKNFHSAITLLSHGANFEETHYYPQYKQRLLSITAKLGPVKILKKLAIDSNLAEIRDKNNLTLLHDAASNGQTEIVDFLLAKNGEFKRDKAYFVDKYGNTPLHLAARHGHIPSMKLLFYDIHTQNKHGSTALHDAVRFNQVEAVQALLEAKADINIKNKKGLTAFDNAVINGNAQIVKQLLAAGAEIGNAFDIAVNKEHVEVVKVLLEAGVKPGNALDIAIKKGNAALVDALLTEAKQVDTRMLTNAVKFGNVEVLTRLLQEVKDINPKIANQTYLVHRAAQQSNPEVIKLFFNDQVNINIQDDKGNTALHLAIKTRNFAVFQELISNPNVDINIKNAAGLTPLDLAYSIKSEGIHMAEALLNKKAVGTIDKTITDTYGLNLFHTAVQAEHIELFTKWIEEKQFAVDALTSGGSPALFISIEQGNLAAVAKLIELKANANFTRSTDKITPLIKAIHENQLNITQHLVAAGADINTQTGGLTPLQRAFLLSHYEVADFLLSKNAKLLTQDEQGFIVFSLEQQRQKFPSIMDIAAKNGLTHLMKLLISEKVDINMSNQNGFTPITLAIIRGDINMTKLLLDNGAKIPKEALQLTENNPEMRALLKFKPVTPFNIQELRLLLTAIDKKYQTPVINEALKILSENKPDQVKYFGFVQRICGLIQLIFSVINLKNCLQTESYLA
ncbi:MAG: ankyrin repeat domain-containing protein [Gammaproteobacteria bacterium]